LDEENQKGRNYRATTMVFQGIFHKDTQITRVGRRMLGDVSVGGKGENFISSFMEGGGESGFFEGGGIFDGEFFQGGGGVYSRQGGGVIALRSGFLISGRDEFQRTTGYSGGV